MPRASAPPTTPVRPTVAPPPLLSHIHSSPTLRHPHESTLPSPFSERVRARTLPRSFRASTWEEVKRREDRVERGRVDGRKARGRELVRDIEWGVSTGVQDDALDHHPRTRSLSSHHTVTEPGPRRISLGFQESLSPVLPSVPPSPAFTTLLRSSPVFSKFLTSPHLESDMGTPSPDRTPRGPTRRPPPSRYSVPSCPPSPETNFSRPLVMGVPRIDSPPYQAGIGGSPLRTPKTTRVRTLGPRKRSALGEASHTNLPTSTSLPSAIFPSQRSPSKKTPLSLRIGGSVASRDGTTTRSSRRRLQSLFTASSPIDTSDETTPTPRNPYPSLNQSLLHSCVSLSLSSPTLSSFDPASISSRSRSRTLTRGRTELLLSATSSQAVDTPSRPSRIRAASTLGRRGAIHRKSSTSVLAEKRSPVLEGLEDVMRMAQEVMLETA